MAKNITLMGADYPDVPAVQLPQTGGGTAIFYDIDIDFGEGTVQSGRGTIESGGCYKYGKIVCMNVVILSTYSAINEPGIYTCPNGFKPKSTGAVTVVESSNINPGTTTGTKQAGRITTDGNVYCEKMESGKYYTVSGCWMTD